MTRVLGDAVYLPPGSLDQFKAAALNHAAERVDIVCFGDSTTVGETIDGGHHSWFENTLRGRFAAAGYTDGGRGISGHGPSQAFAANSGENLVGIQSYSGWGIGTDGLLLLHTAKSTTNGDTIRFQGKGTHVRLIWRADQFTAVGWFSYSLDGGPAVEVHPSANGPYEYVVLGPFAEGTHTLDLVNLDGATSASGFTPAANDTVLATPDWFRAAGLVWHNHAVSGASTAYVSADTKVLPVSLGLVPAGATNDWEATVDPSADARKVRLALYDLGINDTDDSNHANAIHKYALTARQAGADPLVLIPALLDKTDSAEAARRDAIKAACVTDAVPYIDMGTAGPLYPAPTAATTYGFTESNPHLSSAAYTKQGDFVADVLLSYLAA